MQTYKDNSKALYKLKKITASPKLSHKQQEYRNYALFFFKPYFSLLTTQYDAMYTDSPAMCQVLC